MVEPLIRAEKRARREDVKRLKLVGRTANIYAIASIGAAFGGPVLQHQSFGIGNTLGLLAGVTLHAIALYLAPRGDDDDE